MKQATHPEYHSIFIQMTDGFKYETRSTWGKEGDTMILDVDPKTHHAWIGGVSMRKTGQVEKFQNRFGSFGAVKTSAAKDDKKDDKKGSQ